MPKKRTAKPEKRGPQEEGPAVSEDPADARAPLLKPTKSVPSLKAEFDALHAEGMAALKAHDVETLSKVIRREGQVIDQEIRKNRNRNRPK